MCSIAVYLQRKHDLTWLDLCSSWNPTVCYDPSQGCQVQVNKKCEAACKKMSNRFKKCQTSWNRPNAVGFNISRWIIWQKHSGTREKDTNYSIQSNKQLLYFRKNKQNETTNTLTHFSLFDIRGVHGLDFGFFRPGLRLRLAESGFRFF